jgi:hypothetical protein
MLRTWIEDVIGRLKQLGSHVSGERHRIPKRKTLGRELSKRRKTDVIAVVAFRPQALPNLVDAAEGPRFREL